MKQISDIALKAVAITVSVLLMSCVEKYEGDILSLNVLHQGIEDRVASLEKQTGALNSQLSVLSKLSAAVENNFYVTKVKTTGEGYELTLSNGSIIVLSSRSERGLALPPAVSMMQVGGLYYWTQNGVLLTDAGGQPIRTSTVTPLVKYDGDSGLWLLSFDGGVNFVSIDEQAGMVINDAVLLQVINSYFSRYNTTIISEEIVYQIVSTYIQQNYAQLFNVKLLDQVVVSYVNQHYEQLFRYELLEKIFSQYNYEYITKTVKADEITSIMKTFLTEHQEILVNNEVLYEIISNYLKVNKWDVFTEEMLTETVTTFVNTHENFIDIDLLQRVVFTYIDEHQDIVVNNKVVQNLLMQYLERYYVRIFSQEILIRCINTYLTSHHGTIFSETLIKEVLNAYIQNNYKTLISHEVINEIVYNYLKVHSTDLLSVEVLIEIMSSYFEKNYHLFIDREVLRKLVISYIQEHQSTLIGVNIVESVVASYIRHYYTEVFSHDFLTLIIENYFKQNLQVLNQYIGDASGGIVKSVKVSSDVCNVTLNDGKVISLVVFDANALLRDRVQSVVVVPNGNGHVQESKGDVCGFLHLNYQVTPASMADIIREKFYNQQVTIEFMTTDGNGNVGTLPAYEPYVQDGGVLNVSATTPEYGAIKALALHIKESKTGGTDILTDFCVVDSEVEEPTLGYLECPDDHHPHMIDLGLPSGTLWACCNVGAKIPEYSGNYYAWGETAIKSTYSWETYIHSANRTPSTCVSLGDIAGTQYDVAHVQWGEKWQMPTYEQAMELKEYCLVQVTTHSSLDVVKVSGRNNGVMYLPYITVKTAYPMTNNVITAFWSSTPSQTQTYNAMGLGYVQPATTAIGYMSSMDAFRCNGYPIRPVWKP